MSHSQKRKSDRAVAASSRPRVFIVEDEVIIVRGLEESLDRLGYDACGFALSGEKALAAIEAKRPDLVLVDICLGGEMDGIELAHSIRNQGIPVIYLTAYSNREILERAKLTDPAGYVVKPFRDSQLRVNLELALERQRIERERMAALIAYRDGIEDLRRQLDDKDRRLKEATEALNAAGRELGREKAKLDELRQELQEVSRSLLNLTAHMTRTREELEMEVAAALRKRVLPVLRQFQSDPDMGQYHIEMDMLSMLMGCLSSNLAKDTHAFSVLSATELRIAALIKNDLSSEQIARQLFLSLDTVKTHRRSIRKKLGIRNTATNLGTYLKNQWEG